MKGRQYVLTTFRTDTSIWFSVAVHAESASSSGADFATKRSKEANDDDDDDSDDDDIMPAQCICGWHTLCNADRLHALNDAHRSARYTAALKHVALLVGPGSRWLDVSDGSMCAIVAASVSDGQGSFTSVEAKPLSRLLFQRIVDANPAMQDRVDIVESVDDIEEGQLFDVLMAEPYFHQLHNMPLWTALSFWYQRTHLNARMTPTAAVVPSACRIVAMAVMFEHLHVSYGKAGVVEGFDHAALDEAQKERAANTSVCETMGL